MLHVVSLWVKLLSYIELFSNLLDVTSFKLEAQCAEVVLLMCWLSRLGDDTVATGQTPAQDDLARGFGIFLCHLCYQAVTCDIVAFRSHFATNSTEWTVGYWDYVVVHKELNEVILSALWIQTDLVTDGFDMSVC